MSAAIRRVSHNRRTKERTAAKKTTSFSLKCLVGFATRYYKSAGMKKKKNGNETMTQTCSDYGLTSHCRKSVEKSYQIRSFYKLSYSALVYSIYMLLLLYTLCTIYNIFMCIN